MCADFCYPILEKKHGGKELPLYHGDFVRAFKGTVIFEHITSFCDMVLGKDTPSTLPSCDIFPGVLVSTGKQNGTLLIKHDKEELTVLVDVEPDIYEHNERPSYDAGPGPGIVFGILLQMKSLIPSEYGEGAHHVYNGGAVRFGSFGLGGYGEGIDESRIALGIIHKATWMFHFQVRDKDGVFLDNFDIRIRRNVHDLSIKSTEGYLTYKPTAVSSFFKDTR